jgi:hypothetical protein
MRATGDTLHRQEAPYRNALGPSRSVLANNRAARAAPRTGENRGFRQSANASGNPMQHDCHEICCGIWPMTNRAIVGRAKPQFVKPLKRTCSLQGAVQERRRLRHPCPGTILFSRVSATGRTTGDLFYTEAGLRLPGCRGEGWLSHPCRGDLASGSSAPFLMSG